MICRNCGFTNAPGDEFCGSCGTFLEWTGSEAATGTEPTTEMPAAAPPPPVPPVPPPAEPTPPSAPAPVPVAPAPVPAAPAPVPPPPSAGPVSPTPPAGPVPPPPVDPLAVLRPIPAHLVRCATCGTANERTRVFCESCGSRLKQPAGTTGQRAGALATTDGGGGGGINRTYLAIGGLVVLVLLLGAAAVLGGFFDGPSPQAIASASAPGTFVASTSVPTIVPPTQTPAPGETASPVPPTQPPDATAPPPTSSPAPGGRFRCEDQQLTASAPARWQLTSAAWGIRPRFDYISFLLERIEDSEERGVVMASLVPLDDVSSRFGLNPPGSGDIALVLVFEGPIRAGQFARETGQQTLREFEVVRKDGDGYAVLGVSGNGCFELVSPGWADPNAGEVEVTVNISNR